MYDFEYSLSHTDCCEQCNAIEGERHPVALYTIQIHNVMVDGKPTTLCQKCASNLLSGSRYKEFTRKHYPVTHKTRNSLKHLLGNYLRLRLTSFSVFSGYYDSGTSS